MYFSHIRDLSFNTLLAVSAIDKNLTFLYALAFLNSLLDTFFRCRYLHRIGRNTKNSFVRIFFWNNQVSVTRTLVEVKLEKSNLRFNPPASKFFLPIIWNLWQVISEEVY